MHCCCNLLILYLAWYRSLSLSRGTNGAQGDEEDFLPTQLSEGELKKKMKEKDKKGGGVSELIYK